MEHNKGQRATFPIFPDVPDCVTPPVFPDGERSTHKICMAMTLPVLTHQKIKRNGKAVRRTIHTQEKGNNAPTYFIHSNTLPFTYQDPKTVFNLNQKLLKIVKSMDKVLGRPSVGLFVFNTLDYVTFQPLFDVVKERYKCLDFCNMYKQDMIHGKQALDVDNPGIDFVFAFMDITFARGELFNNLVNHLNKPVFLCNEEFIESNKFFL